MGALPWMISANLLYSGGSLYMEEGAEEEGTTQWKELSLKMEGDNHQPRKTDIL